MAASIIWQKGNLRIVVVDGRGTYLEQVDGSDAMGQPRWRAIRKVGDPYTDKLGLSSSDELIKAIVALARKRAKEDN